MTLSAEMISKSAMFCLADKHLDRQFAINGGGFLRQALVTVQHPQQRVGVQEPPRSRWYRSWGVEVSQDGNLDASRQLTAASGQTGRRSRLCRYRSAAISDVYLIALACFSPDVYAIGKV